MSIKDFENGMGERRAKEFFRDKSSLKNPVV